MAYCVKCGVELAGGEPKCPLCQTKVMLAEEESGAAVRPYPKRLDKIEQKIDRKYGAVCASMILAIPIGVSLITDFSLSGRISWSAYVIGAGLCLFFWILLPMFYTKRRPYLGVAINFLSALGYLAAIAYETDFGWFMPLALPITVLAGIMGIVTVYIFKHKETLVACALTVIAAGVITVGIEIFIDLFTGGAISLFWSLIVVTSTTFLGSAFLFINRKKKLKDEIEKRLFI